MTSLQEAPVAADASLQSIAREHDVANYIASIVQELREMALNAGLTEVLAPLDQVYYQAWTAAQRKAQARIPSPKSA